ncbi:MAG: YkgJ family cysteine cluster protein [Deltaproteobacteria bacterium]|nr:YkgJ family cysteine cluster protein [Deltaproteobacteria bacterium]
MGIKTHPRPDYAALARRHKNDSEFSFFEASQANQKAIQSHILEDKGPGEQLAIKLSDATHAHASGFLEQVGRKLGTACEKGCSYCCHQPATAFPFEALRIAGALKATRTKEQVEALQDKMRARVRDLKDSSVRKNMNNKTACPLLSDENQCSVYENRPLTCRMAHSFSVQRCRQSFEKDRAKVQIPMSLQLLTGISGIIEAAFEGLPKKRLDGNLYELCSSVLAALAHPEAAAQWAQGDPRVFKDCIKDDT